MNIQETPVYRELQAIIASGGKPIAHQWRATFHANGVDLPPLYLSAHQLQRDYIGAFADIRSVTIAVPAGVLAYQIVPFKDNLMLTLQKIPLLDTMQPTVKQNAEWQAYRYRAHLFDNASAVVQANTPNMNKQSVADRTQLLDVQVQLVDLVVEQIRTATVGGIFRRTSGANLIRALLGKYSELEASDQAVAIRGVDIAPGASTIVREHIVVPHYTPLPAIPRIVNEQCGGVYNTGMSFYMQQQMWYLFSPFDIRRFQTTARTLTIVNVPDNRFPQPEVSYRLSGQQVIMIATGKVEHIDLSEQTVLNQGNGTAFVQADRVMAGMGVVENNKLTVQRKQNINEMVYQQRENKVNVVRESDNRITSNNASEMSRLAARAGSFMQVVWQNSNDRLLYPGMPVKFMFIQDGTPEEIYGCLVGMHSEDFPSTQNVKDQRFTTQTVLKLFVNAKIKFDSEAAITGAFK